MAQLASPQNVPASADLVNEVAEFAATVDIASVPANVVEAAKRNVLDTLSCILAGSSAKGVGDVCGLVREWGGAPQADMLVLGGRFPAHHVAWANSVMAHARDYDDTHDAAILHAGISTVPAAIAAAQLHGARPGADLLAAVIAGLEVTCRLGVAVQIDIVESGFIYSSLLGYFGATAAAGRALGLTADEMLSAFGIIYSSAAGNHQVTRDASLMKRIQPGLGAQAAVVAAQLAKRGIRGPHNVFEGDDGFFRVYFHNRVKPDVVRDELGERFELLNLSYKPYPCCRDTHAAIDATLEARGLQYRDASEIEAIDVGVTGPGYQMVCVPEAVRLAPKTIVEAQFSIPYTVATAWIDGQVGMTHFSDEALHRSDILALAGKVRPYVDEDIDREWSRYVTPGKVTIHFRDGTQVETRVDYPKGHPNNMMTADEFAAKTADCAGYADPALPEGTAEQLAATVARLDTLADVDELVGLLTP